MRTWRCSSNALVFALLSMSDADQKRTHWQQLAALLVTRAKTGDRVLRGIFTYRLADTLTHPPFPKPDMPDRRKPLAPSVRKRSKASARRARRPK